MLSRYSTDLLKSIFKCNKCGNPLLMFGCDNPNCNNYWEKQLQRRNNNDIT